MTKGQGLRQYRACTRCRSRKTRCDLQTVGEPGKPPCAKCLREGSECVLAGSRRGGDFTQFRRSRNAQRSKKPGSACSPANVPFENVSPRQYKNGEVVHDSLQNPSDALLILANAADIPCDDAGCGELSNQNASQTSLSNKTARYSRALGCRDPFGLDLSSNRTTAEGGEPSLQAYPLIQDGALSIALVEELLILYTEHYHQYMPLAPASALQTERLADTIQNESFLLTAILVIATKNRPDLSVAHKAIWRHMRQLILDVVLGLASVRRVGCVEGLLLLGEWTPLNQGQNSDGGEGASWSIFGLAIRLAYLLRLEDSSFKVADEEADPVTQRERLAWTFTYLSDRQISIRMGQAFWSRGPGLNAKFLASDFPTLQPHHHRSSEDLASLLQAQVELTTLFGNAHDILFASRSRTAELMMRGDYTKYVDDTIRAMTAWHQAWQSISVPSHLRSCLFLMYEYLRLYVNAFAFQAVLYRESAKNQDSGPAFFPSSIMASPDARHIYAAIDAAERMLIMAVEDIDPKRHLRYMPARFYLYEIHSAVFLYKAHAVGAIDWEKHAQTATLMQRFISVLNHAAVDEEHIASQYGRLLERLWIQRRPAGIGNDSGQTADQGLSDPLTLIGPDPMASQMPLFEGIGLQSFDCSDTFEALFSMPPVFPIEQPGLF